MLSGGQSGPVVVAVGEAGDGHAVDWAAAEASARDCPLHVVHVTRPRWAVDPSGLVPVADFRPYRLAAEAVLQAAMTRARSVAHDLEVSGYVAFGPTVASLVAQGRGAQLLVVGGRPATYPGRLGAIAPSVCSRVVARAPCPVAVVRPLRCSPHAGSSPRVVVGVSGFRSCAPALGFALAAASQRGLPVTAVLAWTPDRPADHEAVSGPDAGTEARARSALGRALATCRSEFADVPVEARLVCGDPAAALIRESEGAALVVVGACGRRIARATAFGSVSRSVTRRARCPAVVVRAGRPGQDGDARTGRPGAIPLEMPPGTEPVRRRRIPWQ
jgi:nucleotide-binding universal stress UspA family protein